MRLVEISRGAELGAISGERGVEMIGREMAGEGIRHAEPGGELGAEQARAKHPQLDLGSEARRGDDRQLEVASQQRAQLDHVLREVLGRLRSEEHTSELQS